MKEILTVLVSIVLVCTGAVISQNYLNKTSDELVGEIENLRAEIQKAKLDENNTSIKLSEDIYDKWKNIEKKWSLIVIHTELDQIELSLIGMNADIKEKEYEKAMEELEKSVFLLQHIKEKERLALKNVL